MQRNERMADAATRSSIPSPYGLLEAFPTSRTSGRWNRFQKAETPVAALVDERLSRQLSCKTSARILGWTLRRNSNEDE